MPAAKPEYTNYSMFVDARFEKVCHNDKGTFLLVLRVSRFFLKFRVFENERLSEISKRFLDLKEMIKIED